MNNEIDLLDELEREEREERLATSGGGAGAALGVVLTLLIGCGLVFSAYKLGQRKTVDEPPLIAAADGPIKIAPENPGGSEIANTGNLANAMIDGSRPAGSGTASSDGVMVEANLRERAIDQAASIEEREIRREIIEVTDLEMKPSLEGEPSLNVDGAPDRSDEHLMVSGAEVTPNARRSLDTLAANAAAADAGRDDIDLALNIPDGEGSVTIPPVAPAINLDAETSNTTTIAAALAAPDGPVQIAMRVPTLKPNLGPFAPRQAAATDAPSAPALAPETRPAPQRVRQPLEPAIARVTPTPPAQPRGNQLVQPTPQLPTNPGVRRVRIPPQPVGDAQVQLGAFPSPNEVRGRWAAIKGRNPDLLGQLGLQVLPVQTADGRRLFRMRVGPIPSTQQAAQLCQALAGRGIDCFVPQRRKRAGP